MNRSIIFSLILALFSSGSIAQLGGNTTYGFLNLTTSARVMALGTKSIAIDDDDLNLTYNNPALLNANMHNHLLVNYVKYFGGIDYGYMAYAPGTIGEMNVAAGLHYLNYGSFQKADKDGIRTGSFQAAEYAVNLTVSRSLDSTFGIGVNFKPVYSQLYEYTSMGIAADVGLLYSDTSGLFSAALVLKNIGTQIIPYTTNHYEHLPFEIQLGATFKLEHAPFRFSIVAEHIDKPDLTYTLSPEDSRIIYRYYQGNAQKSSLFDKVMRHMILGVELTPVQHFYLRAGYHYRRRQEMKVESRLSAVGFSWGFGIKLFKLYMNYGRGTYHLAGGTNHFSVRINFNEY